MKNVPSLLMLATALSLLITGLISGPSGGIASGENVTAISGLSRPPGKSLALGPQAARQSLPASERAAEGRGDLAGSSSGAMGLELARHHFRDLLPVLDHLRVHSPQQYEKAIRDLDRSAKRLESIKRRDAKLFEISLREWQLRGQIDLLKATLRVKKSESGRQAMLRHLQSLRQAEQDRIERELVLIDEREVAYKDRIEQVEALIERNASLRKQLNEQRQRLEAEPIDIHSNVYLKAIGTNKNDPDRSAPPSKSKSKKANP